MSVATVPPPSAEQTMPRASRLPWVLICALVGLLATVALLSVYALSEADRYRGVLIVSNALAALGLNIIFGMSKLLSVAQTAMVAVSAYTLALLLERTGIPLGVSMALAVVAATAVSATTGLLAMRVRSHYFILVTLSVVGIVQVILVNAQELTGGSDGMAVPVDLFTGKQQSLLLVSAALLWIGWYFAQTILRSRSGRAMMVVGEDESLAVASGISLQRTWLMASALGGLFAGVAGVLYAVNVRYLGPSDFGLDKALLLLLIVVAGGMGSPTGVVIAALVLTYVSIGLPELATWGPMVYGGVMIVLLLVFPGGLAEAARVLRRRLMWRRRRRLAVHAPDGDDGGSP